MKLTGVLRAASLLATAVVFVLISPIIVTVGQGETAISGAKLAGVVVAALLAGLFSWLEITAGGRRARAHEKRLRRELLSHAFAQAERGNLDQYPPARLVTLMTQNVEKFTEYYDTYLGPTLVALSTPFLVLLYVGVAIDPVLGFSVMAMCVVIPLVLAVFSRVTRKSSAASRRQRGALSGRYLDAIRTMSTIRLMGAGQRVERDLARLGEANRKAVMRMLAQNQIIIIIIDGLFSLLLVCSTVILVGARSDLITPAQALTAFLLTILLLEPLSQVAGFFYVGMGGLAARKAIRGFLQATPELVLSSAPAADVASPNTPSTQPLLTVSDVGFDYGRGPVLSAVNLTIHAGERVALVGPSGAGKTTLADLLRGALAVQTGHIDVGTGADVTSTGQPEPQQGAQAQAAPSTALLRGQVASVRQTTWMFTGTIADNLRLAAPEASEKDMWQALERAHVDADVRGMPEGLNTYLGENSALISGGQAQRISLARGFLSGRRILVLDEPTSQVDLESEQRIIDVIAGLDRSWTLIMVTHRRSLLRLADTIYQVKDGQVIRQEPGDSDVLAATDLAETAVEPPAGILDARADTSADGLASGHTDTAADANVEDHR